MEGSLYEMLAVDLDKAKQNKKRNPGHHIAERVLNLTTTDQQEYLKNCFVFSALISTLLGAVQLSVVDAIHSRLHSIPFRVSLRC